MALDTFVFGLKFPEEVLRDYAVPNVYCVGSIQFATLQGARRAVHGLVVNPDCTSTGRVHQDDKAPRHHVLHLSDFTVQ